MNRDSSVAPHTVRLQQGYSEYSSIFENILLPYTNPHLVDSVLKTDTAGLQHSPETLLIIPDYVAAGQTSFAVQ